MIGRIIKTASVTIFAIAMTATGAAAQNCNTGNFGQWLQEFRNHALNQGISPRTVTSALNGITFSQEVVNRDRRQGVFSQTFLEFSDRMVAQYRLDRGKQHLRNKASMFGQIEQRYGVPGPIIVSFWGLETDFGANIGDMPVLRSLATLAYDCRRPQMFREELLAAMRIIDKGDLTADRMIGPWAGEMGQTQFLASHYDTYGVDFDGDGRRDLLRSSADALASAANLLKAHGWRAGQPWLQEVRVPNDMPWEETGLDKQHSISDWQGWGVQPAHGGWQGSGQASLVLPMGRNGPAFIAYPNFNVYLEWNQSFIYALTAAYYATRLDGAPRVSQGRGNINSLSDNQTKQLQQILQSRGHDVGKVDGIIGARTREAVRAVQLELGMPADSYPTAELLQRLR